MAAKIKDGLFIGDAETSQDPEFLELNKISNLVNVAGDEVENTWAPHGLAYLTYSWRDEADCELFDDGLDSVKEMFEFIEGSIEFGISVLVFSARGCGRCTAAVCVYFMYKFGWGFEKAYDFVYAKKPDIDLNRGFIRQMFAVEKLILTSKFGLNPEEMIEGDSMRVSAMSLEYLTMKSNIQPIISLEESGEEAMLISCYLNGRQSISALPPPSQHSTQEEKGFALKFNPVPEDREPPELPENPPPISMQLRVRSANGKGGILRKGGQKGRHAIGGSQAPTRVVGLGPSDAPQPNSAIGQGGLGIFGSTGGAGGGGGGGLYDFVGLGGQTVEREDLFQFETDRLWSSRSRADQSDTNIDINTSANINANVNANVTTNNPVPWSSGQELNLETFEIVDRRFVNGTPPQQEQQQQQQQRRPGGYTPPSPMNRASNSVKGHSSALPGTLCTFSYQRDVALDGLSLAETLGPGIDGTGGLPGPSTLSIEEIAAANLEVHFTRYQASLGRANGQQKSGFVSKRGGYGPGSGSGSGSKSRGRANKSTSKVLATSSMPRLESDYRRTAEYDDRYDPFSSTSTHRRQIW
jgi:hypothetical protein